jgi:capsular polysaccharide biosynthesis protein
VTRPVALVVVLFTAAAVAALAYAVDDARVPDRTATTVLVVPTVSAGSVADDPSGAGQLAATYVSLLPLENGVVNAVARGSGMSADTVRRSLTARRPSSSGALIRFTLRAPSDGAALRGLSALSSYLRRAQSEPNNVIAPRSLQVVGAPRAVSPSANAPEGVSPTTVAGVSRRRLTVLVLAPKATADIPDAQAANRLAANYAGLLPDDVAVLRVAARRAGMSVKDLGDNLRASNDANTSLVRVSVTDPDYSTARRAANAIAAALTGPDPVTESVSPNTLQVARAPDTRGPSSSDRSRAVAIGGLVIGLLFGIATVLAYNNRHPRLRSAVRSRDLLNLPTTDVTAATRQLMSSLLGRWRDDGATTVNLLPEDAGVERVAAQLADALDMVSARDEGPLVSVRARTYADALEPQGAASSGGSGYDVLVAARGRRYTDVHSALVRYETRGGRVRWVLLTSRKAPPPSIGIESDNEREHEHVPA